MPVRASEGGEGLPLHAPQRHNSCFLYLYNLKMGASLLLFGAAIAARPGRRGFSDFRRNAFSF
jgi:hypothetical protein